MANDYDNSDSTNAEIHDQVDWTEKVRARVLRETGCFLSHEGMVIIVTEFANRVEEISKRKWRQRMTSKQYLVVYLSVLFMLSVAILVFSGKQKDQVAALSCGTDWLYHEQINTKVETATDVDERILAAYIVQEYNTKPELATKIVKTVYDYTASIDFPTPHLVLAVIAVESSFRPKVRSSAGAMGLMQVLPINNPGDSNSIDDNIIAGIFLLQNYKQELKVDTKTIMAYNMGIGNFKRGRFNHSYVKKVIDKQKEFEKVLQF